MHGYDPSSDAQTPGNNRQKRKRKRNRAGKRKGTLRGEDVSVLHARNTHCHKRRKNEGRVRQQQSELDKHKDKLLAAVQHVIGLRVRECFAPLTQSLQPLHDTFWKDIPIAQPAVATKVLPTKRTQTKRVFQLSPSDDSDSDDDAVPWEDLQSSQAEEFGVETENVRVSFSQVRGRSEEREVTCTNSFAPLHNAHAPQTATITFERHSGSRRTQFWRSSGHTPTLHDGADDDGSIDSDDDQEEDVVGDEDIHTDDGSAQDCASEGEECGEDDFMYDDDSSEGERIHSRATRGPDSDSTPTEKRFRATFTHNVAGRKPPLRKRGPKGGYKRMHANVHVRLAAEREPIVSGDSCQSTVADPAPIDDKGQDMTAKYEVIVSKSGRKYRMRANRLVDQGIDKNVEIYHTEQEFVVRETRWMNESVRFPGLPEDIVIRIPVHRRTERRQVVITWTKRDVTPILIHRIGPDSIRGVHEVATGTNVRRSAQKADCVRMLAKDSGLCPNEINQHAESQVREDDYLRSRRRVAVGHHRVQWAETATVYEDVTSSDEHLGTVQHSVQDVTDNTRTSAPTQPLCENFSTRQHIIEIPLHNVTSSSSTASCTREESIDIRLSEVPQMLRTADCYGLWRYKPYVGTGGKGPTGCWSTMLNGVKDKKDKVMQYSLHDNGVTVIDELWERQDIAIWRWAMRQGDLGRRAIIVNAFGGVPYTGCRLPNVVSLAVSDPTKLKQLQSHFSDVLVVGCVSDNTQQSWTEVQTSRAFNFVVAVGDTHFRTIEDGDLYTDAHFRQMCQEQFHRDTTSVQDRLLITVSTVPLTSLPSDDDALPVEDTVGSFLPHLDSALAHSHLEFDSRDVPVYKLKDLPRYTDDDRKDGVNDTTPITMLGYNCNGIRASYVHDDWEKILEDSPDVIAICELKGAFYRLKTFMGGAMWNRFRAMYPYIHIFSARSPNTGTHGTALMSKLRPDGWVTGIGDDVFDGEGRQVGAIIGNRIITCTYAQTAGFQNAALEKTKRFWKAKEKASLHILHKGYEEQGFGDLNVVRDLEADCGSTTAWQGGVCAQRPSTTKEERKLLKNYLVNTQMMDYHDPRLKGSKYFTYFHTLKDRNRADGTRIDYFYGGQVDWSSPRCRYLPPCVSVRSDIPGSDHLPVACLLPRRKADDTYENDLRGYHSRKHMLEQLNPREIQLTQVMRLQRALRVLDGHPEDAIEVDDRPDRDEKVDMVVRKVYAVRKVDTSQSVTPRLGFRIGNAQEVENHILDTGADVNIMSLWEAKRYLGKNFCFANIAGEIPLELSGVFGAPETARGSVLIPVKLQYNTTKLIEREVHFYVFDDPATPTLFGMPALQQLGVGVAPVRKGENTVVMATIAEPGGKLALEPLVTGSGQSACYQLHAIQENIPLVAAQDFVLKPGRNIVSVNAPNGCNGRTCMAMVNMEHLQTDGEGFILENNTFTVEGNSAHLSLKVVGNNSVTVTQGTLLNRAVVLPERCVKEARFVKNDLVRQTPHPDSAQSACTGPAAGVPGEPRPRTVLRADSASAPSASPSNTPKVHSSQNGVFHHDSQPPPAIDPSHDQFYTFDRYKRFREGGLRMFRPTIEEATRLKDIPEYSEDGEKRDTFDEICQVLLRADDMDTIYEKGTHLPVANTVAEVTIKEGAKKVVSGFAQNNNGPGADRVVQKEVDNLVALNAAERAKFDQVEYCSRIMLVPKPNGDWRFCVDLRGVNKNVQLEHWPLTKVDIRLQGMAGSQFFSTLDLPQAFHNIPLAPESRKYFGFKAPDGLYRYKTLPMGYVNSMALFTRLMDTSMIGLGDFVSVYVDDLIVYSRTWTDHLQHLDRVFHRLHKAGLKVNLAKCAFAREEVPFLGHLVTRQGIRMDPAKVAAIRDMPLPDDLTKLRSFLGATGHYRKFVKDYSKVAHPLSELTKKCANLKREIQSESCKQAFDLLKKALCGEQVLQHPDIDRQWVLSCDASKYGVGCVLQQRIGSVPDRDDTGTYVTPKPSQLRPIAYFSRKLSEQEINSYCIYEKEAYAVVWGLEICKSYIMGSRHPVMVFTDNKALVWLKDSENPGRLGRWQAELGMYNMHVVHQPATQNVVSDNLSRNAVNIPTDCVKVPRIRALRQVPRMNDMFKGAVRRVPIENVQGHFVRVEYGTDGPVYVQESQGQPVYCFGDECTLAARLRFWDNMPPVRGTNVEGVHPNLHYTVDVRQQQHNTTATVLHCAPTPVVTLPAVRIATSVSVRAPVHYKTRVMTRSRGRDAEQSNTISEAELESKHDGTPTGETSTADIGEHKEEPRVAPDSVLADQVLDITGTEQLVEFQAGDKTWKPVIQHLKAYSGYWDKYNSFQKLPEEVRQRMDSRDQKLYGVYMRQFLLDKHGLLRRRKHIKSVNDEKGQYHHALCVPKMLVTGVLRFHHGTPISGHLGINKLESVMTRRYHWPKMSKDIRRWVNGCATCQRRKQFRPMRQGLQHPHISSRPWQRAYMDLVGPLPESDNHSTYMLTIVDSFSKWPMAIPLPNKKAETIAEAIYKNLITVHGCPEELFSDNEATLLAHATSTMCDNLGIKRITSSSYAPWQNGQVERFHRFLGAALSIYASERKKDWDKWIDCILFTYRVSVHPQTGESPYRIIYNRDPHLGMDLLTGYDITDEDRENKTSEAISTELIKWFKIIKMRQTILARKQMELKNAKDSRCRKAFEKDDWVLLFEPPVTHTTQARQWKVPKKFQDTLSGPHRVVGSKANDKGEWEILHGRRGQKEWVHVTRMVLYNPWSEEILNTAEGSLVPGHDIRNGAIQGDPYGPAQEEQPKVYRLGDDVHVGELVAVCINPDNVNKQPFMIVKLLELHEHLRASHAGSAETYRPLVGHIYGNSSSIIHGVFRPGWVDPTDNRPYFRTKPSHQSHPPYTTTVSHGDVTTWSVILADFQLNTADKLPANVVAALKDSEYLSWEEDE